MSSTSMIDGHIDDSRGMSDEDIINAWKEKEMIANRLDKDARVSKWLCKESIDLIERYKTEVERLNKEVDRLSQCVLYHDGHIVDVIKDFADEVYYHINAFFTDENKDVVMKLKELRNVLNIQIAEMEDKQ